LILLERSIGMDPKTAFAEIGLENSRAPNGLVRVEHDVYGVDYKEEQLRYADQFFILISK
jgi:hypothetical protein